MTRKGKRSDARETPATRGGHAHGPFPPFPRSRAASFSRKHRRFFPVTEEQKQPQPEMKDERDLIIEDLKKRMEKIESDYQMKIGEYQKANGELWARLHPAAQPEPAPEAPKKDPYEVMLDSFNSTLGINKEKKG